VKRVPEEALEPSRPCGQRILSPPFRSAACNGASSGAMVIPVGLCGFVARCLDTTRIGEYMVVTRHRRAVDANPVLLTAGAASLVVAIVGLFVRSSPGLSCLFVVAGTGMLVVSVLVPRPPVTTDEIEPAVPTVDLSQLERSAYAAETQIAEGALPETEPTVTAGTDTSTGIHAFVADAAKNHLRGVDEDLMRALTKELESLPTLEETSQIAPLDEVPAGYQCITLPSGYVVLYRHLTPVEIRRATGRYGDQPGYLIADLLPLVGAFNAHPTVTATRATT